MYMKYPIESHHFTKVDEMYIYDMNVDEESKSVNNEYTIFINLSEISLDLDGELYLNLDSYIHYIYVIGTHNHRVVIHSPSNSIIYVEDLKNITATVKPTMLIVAQFGMYNVTTLSNAKNGYLVLGDYIICNNRAVYLDHHRKTISDISISECPNLQKLNSLIGYLI